MHGQYSQFLTKTFGVNGYELKVVILDIIIKEQFGKNRNKGLTPIPDQTCTLSLF
jgi:hypothetical protein